MMSLSTSKYFGLLAVAMVSILFAPVPALTQPSVTVAGDWEIRPIVSGVGADITDVAVGQGGDFVTDVYYFLTGGSIYRVPPEGLPAGDKGTLVASGLSPNYGYLEFGFDNSMFIVNSTVAAPVRRLDEPNGPISVFVSLGRGSEGIRFDRNQVFNGNLYVSTWWDDQIWSVDSNGNPTVLVAQVSTPGLGSVTTDIDFTKPGSQFEKDGKPWLYAVDQGGKITRVDAAGNLELFTNGPGSEVLRFSKPGSVFGDYIYIAPYNNQILRIDANGNVSVFATGFAGTDVASTGIEFHEFNKEVQHLG